MVLVILVVDSLTTCTMAVGDVVNRAYNAMVHNNMILSLYPCQNSDSVYSSLFFAYFRQ